MNTPRQLRNFWVPWVATIILTCLGNAVAQARYRVTDLGAEGNDNLGCAMSVNDEGWTEIMAGSLPPGEQDSLSGTLVSGRALIDVDGFKFDLGTLGGKNSWMNFGEINDFGQVVGYSETKVPDPNGEDVCGFGTHRKCLPFLWQFFHMSALPLLGGNNGQASSINNRGQIGGFAETATVDSGCPPNLIRTPVLWKNDKAHPIPLPTVDGDPDGDAVWINDEGQAAGSSGNCSGTVLHAVSWENITAENVTASALPDFGTGAFAQGMNNQGQIVGSVGTADNLTQTGALWQNKTLTTLDLLPGDFGGLASGINSKGQVVGSNWDSNFNWSHAFIWQDNVTTDLNTLFPASTNLCAVMANKINERGQISGMAIVRSGPDAGNIHAFLATPVNQSMGKSVADVAPTCAKSNLPANVGQQLAPRFRLGRLE